MLLKARISALIAGLVLFSFPVKSEDSIRKKPIFAVKPAYLDGMLPESKNLTRTSKNFLIDSLSLELILMKRQNDSLAYLLNNELLHKRLLEKDVAGAKEENRNRERELELIRGDQLQTTHKSSVLLIFNVLVGIILLVALVWIFNRKKPEENQAGTMEKIVAKSSADPMERKMERIEKLGKLRDKGLLTDEEFLSQKKQILG